MNATLGAKTSAGVTVVELDLKPQQPQWFLLRSDAHHDSTSADQAMEERHLKEAVARDALICDIGDLFDCMNGRYDKRADREHLRPEYQHGPYMNRLVDVAYERYRPYADRWLLMSPGNHETAVAKHNDFDLTQQLFSRLRPHAPLLNLGKYQGFVRIMVGRGKAQRCGSLAIAYHHGFGGSAPVTRGVIQTNRMAIAYPDADIVWSGHTHTEFYLSIARLRLIQDAVKRDEQIHIRSPGYKEDTSHGSGWAVEKGFMPQSLGAWWLKVWLEHAMPHRLYVIRYALEAAK